MLLDELILETPMDIDDWDFGLDDLDTNIDLAKEMLSGSELKVPGIKIKNPNIKLIKYRNKIGLIDKSHLKPRLYYFLQFNDNPKTGPIKNISKVCQIGVWVLPGAPETEGIAKNIFFNYILKKYDVIITDALQTSDGKRFWLNRIRDAFDKNLYLYYVKIDGPKYLQQFSSYLELEELNKKHNIWSGNNSSKTKRIVISNVEIK